nr:hypothetical protein OG999_04305 [Streptomyces sp. NBC_00886]
MDDSNDERLPGARRTNFHRLSPVKSAVDARTGLDEVARDRAAQQAQATCADSGTSYTSYVRYDAVATARLRGWPRTADRPG